MSEKSPSELPRNEEEKKDSLENHPMMQLMKEILAMNDTSMGPDADDSKGCESLDKSSSDEGAEAGQEAELAEGAEAAEGVEAAEGAEAAAACL